jgi:hypothetical protein
MDRMPSSPYVICLGDAARSRPICASARTQRKLLTPDDFGDLDGLAEEILAFEQHYNATARPFDWKFTRAGLNQLLARISHDPFTPQPLAA